MTIKEARGFVGQEVSVCWRDRNGEELNALTKIYSADFVPLYGPCLITDAGEIRLDRVVACSPSESEKIA